MGGKEKVEKKQIIRMKTKKKIEKEVKDEDKKRIRK